MIKYLKKINLKTQLLFVSSLSLLIVLLFILIVLPIITKPFYEKNIYQILKHPTNYINTDFDNTNSDIAYIIENKHSSVLSNNFYQLLGNDNPIYILNKIKSNYGKFKLDNKTFYYYKVKLKNTYITTFMNDSYIKTQQKNLSGIVIPTIFIILIITLSILILYSNYLVKKITALKLKIENLNSHDFHHNLSFKIDDELQNLNESIEKMRHEINQKETYKNNMFQSISHELKTPITVIGSYTEAIKDKMITNEEALPIIEEELTKLNNYVGSILELNKIAFVKSNNKLKHYQTNIKEVIERCLNKFRLIRTDVNITIISKKDYFFTGAPESWEQIINNILSNFLRYAKKEIKITINKEEIILFNDGEHIDEKIINDIFKPYEKGNNGSTGLGLSIVYMTLDMLDYTIKAKNIKKGVEFYIQKK